MQNSPVSGEWERERGVEERCGRGGSRQFKQPLDTLWMISHFYVTLKPKYFAFL